MFFNQQNILEVTNFKYYQNPLEDKITNGEFAILLAL